MPVESAQTARQNISKIFVSDAFKWADTQAKAEVAAILTYTVDRAGFFSSFPNKDAFFLTLANRLPKGTNLSETTASNLKDLSDEFCARAEADELVGYGTDFPQEVLAQTFFSGTQLAIVLNHNLLRCRDSLSLSALPEPFDVSLEALYGYVVSRWRETLNMPILRALIVSVPLLTASPITRHVLLESPSKRKSDRVCIKILGSNTWMERFGCFPTAKRVLESSDIKLLQILLDTIRKHSRSEAHCPDRSKCVGAKIRRKLHSILRQLELLQGRPDDVWRIQKKVKSLGIDEDDYRSSGNIDQALLEALKLALRRLPTDIQISNMATVRDPTKHFLYDFLKSKVDSSLSSGTNDSRRRLCHIAGLSGELRRLRIYKSDWKNKIVREWNETRASLIARNQCGKFEYGPANFDLALDLFPHAHAFSFTYGRAQGYGLDPLDDSLKELIDNVNNSEKQFFMYLVTLEDPPSSISFLKSVPVWIKDPIRNQISRTSSVSPNEMSTFFTSLQSWLLSDEGQKSACGGACRHHIQTALEDLPDRLQVRASGFAKDGRKIKYVSAMALYNAVMTVCDGPGFLADALNRQAPTVVN
jgi:hypothetical protein